MNSFFIAGWMHYEKHSGLKHHKSIISQLQWASNLGGVNWVVFIGSHKVKIKGLVRLHFFKFTFLEKYLFLIGG